MSAACLGGHQRLAPTTIAAGCLAIGVTACGGHTVTKQDVIARANGICITTLHAVSTCRARRREPPAALAPYLDKVVPIVERRPAAAPGPCRPAIAPSWTAMWPPSSAGAVPRPERPPETAIQRPWRRPGGARRPPARARTSTD